MDRLYTGTSAYKLETYENYTKKSEEKSAERKNNARLEHAAFCRLVVMLVIGVFVAASAIIYVNVMMLRAATEIDNLETKLALEVDKNNQKEMEINKNLDLNVIEKRAIEELGMQKPDNSQIVYINVKKGTHSQTVNPKGEKKNVFSLLKSAVGSLQEYFS